MDSTFFVRGVVLGLSLAVPVGPMAILCIQRTLRSGYRHGVMTGLGVASADAIYGAVAGLGLSVVTQMLVAGSEWLRLVGGAMLCLMGWRAVRSAPPAAPGDAPAPDASTGGSLGAAYLSTVLLTLTNPMTILTFVALFGGLGLGSGVGRGAAVLLVAGVFSGSVAWWLVLSGAAALLRDRLTSDHLHAITRIAGLALLGFGLALVLTMLRA